MPVLFTYLLKLSLALTIVYFFYAVALRRLTFYNWNRWYLLLYTALCFLFPLIDVSALFSAEESGSNHIIYLVPALSEFNNNTIVYDDSTTIFSTWIIIAVVLASGMLFLLVRLFVQLYSYRSMRRNASLISHEGISVYETNLSTVPFSFGRSVFINPAQHTEEELAEIIKHEFVHVKQVHTMDVLWGELLCILNWFNPFAWLLRNAIRQNLEFIADDKVLQEGIDKKEYQYLLLKVTGNKQYSIAHSFNFSSLKKRIAMMNKTKTAKLQLMRFLFLLPVVVVMLLVFRKQSDAQTNSPINSGSGSMDIRDTVAPVKEVTLVPLPPALINYQKDVKDVSIKENIVTVFLQNEMKEQYNLADKKQREALEKKYGKMPNVPILEDTSVVPVKEVILEPRSVTRTDNPQVRQYVQQEIEKRIGQEQQRNKIDNDKENSQAPSKTSAPAKQSKVSTPSAPAKISSIDKPSELDTVIPAQSTWHQWQRPGLSTNLTRVSTQTTRQQWKDIQEKEDKSRLKSNSAPVGRAKISLKGNGKPISYIDDSEKPESLRIDHAIVTAESISVSRENHSLNLKGEASFKNDQGVQAYASTIELSLKQLSSLPYILIDNKELDWDKDYSSNYKQTYEVSFLKKEDAIRKYGDKGKDGALEITSL